MILISYRHENSEIETYASELGKSLVSDGFNVKLDTFEPNQVSWIDWMDHALSRAKYVLLICTPSYRQIFDNSFKENEGRGAAWEIQYIKSELYDNHGRNTRFIPILLGSSCYNDIPKRLRPYRHYRHPEDYAFLLERLQRPQGSIESHSTLGKENAGLVEPVKLQVMLSQSEGKPTSLRERFVYSSRSTKFIGRSEELKKLKEFCEEDEPFAWMSITGPAGIGKSRLCLEFGHSMSKTWNAGFVPQWSVFSDWEYWKPAKDTLLIFDYVQARIHAIASACAAFTIRADTFKHKVRILLVERTTSTSWYSEITNSSSARTRLEIERREFCPPLELSALSNKDVDVLLNQIIINGLSKRETIFDKIRQQIGTKPDRNSISVKDFGMIDLIHRPLFAMFVADAVNGGENPRQWDKDAVLLNVLDREEARWDDIGVSVEIRNLIALSTACGGLLIDVDKENDFLRQKSLFPCLNNIVQSISRIEMMLSTTLSVEDQENNITLLRIPTIEPDLVGELFVLQTISRLPSLQAKMFAQLCWRNYPVELWDFVYRASGDFPGHVGVELLCHPQMDTKEARLFWGLLLSILIPKAFSDGSVPALRAMLPGFYILMDSSKKHHTEKALQYEAMYSAWHMWRYLWDAADFDLAREIEIKYLPKEAKDSSYDYAQRTNHFQRNANKILKEYQSLIDKGFNIEPVCGRIQKAAFTVFENSIRGKKKACEIGLKIWGVTNDRKHPALRRSLNLKGLELDIDNELHTLAKMAVYLKKFEKAVSFLDSVKARLLTTSEDPVNQVFSPSWLPWWYLANAYKDAYSYEEAIAALKNSMVYALDCPSNGHDMVFQAANSISRWQWRFYDEHGFTAEAIELRNISKQVLKVNFHCKNMTEEEFEEWWSKQE